MKPAKPMLTSGQQPIAKDSGAAFVLLVVLLFALLPWEKAALGIGLLFGIALPMVLVERQMIFAYNDGRSWRGWYAIGIAYAIAGVVGLGVFQFHRFGLLSWWPA